MDQAQLIAFERVVRERSFSRAAWALGLAQPTVSERIRALERAVGGSLFVRGARGAVLTDLGAGFLPYARRALEVLDAGVEVARQSRAGKHGRVTIGVLESLSGAFLAPALAAFHADHPQVEVMVRAGHHEQLVELLLGRRYRVGADRAWPCPDSLVAEMEALLTLRERAVLVAAPTHPLARVATVDAASDAASARPLLVLRWWLALPPPLAQLAERVQPMVEVPMATGYPHGAARNGRWVFPLDARRRAAGGGAAA